jgi:arginyl-tRNA synthetase
MNIFENIKQYFNATIQTTWGINPNEHQQIDLTLNCDPQRAEFGDFSSNAPLIAAKILKKNPRLAAQELMDAIKHPSVERLEIAGPGFLNIYLTQAGKEELFKELFSHDFQTILSKPISPLSYSVEYVSANPTGPLHFGHGRSGVIGDVYANICAFLGHEVTKEYYINDAGSQINKLGNSLKIRCLQQIGTEAHLPEDAYQGEYLIELARSCVHQFGQDVSSFPDSFFEDYAKNYMLGRIQETCQLYGITFDVWFSEKTLHVSGAIKDALNILKTNGFLYEADGALWFKSTHFGDDKDRVVLKSTGEYTYVAADIAYLLNKIQRGAQKIILVLGQDHHSYVTRLKGIMAALGYNADDLHVILYQLVTIKETGAVVRMSKRTGKIVSLFDVIETVGADVARFFYLHRKADAHLEFDIDLALKHTDENPVYYIQYGYVRTGSMLEKANSVADLQAITSADCVNPDEDEVLLLKKIASLATLLETIRLTYQTHLLTYYTVELATMFHRFYANHKVVDPSNVTQSRRRIALITTLRKTFETCFKLLGITQPEKM